jgi:hypothetical protein
MNIETRKINLIHWITRLTDEEVLEQIESLKNKDADWWDLISIEEKSEIEQGLAEIERGETKTHEAVMSKYKKWL